MESNLYFSRQDSANDAAWCATEVDPAGNVVFNKWGDCQESVCPVEEGGECDTVGGPGQGQPCVFPFSVGGETHWECTTGSVETGCSTVVLWGVITVKTCKVRTTNKYFCN